LENISLAIFDEVYCTNAEHSSKLRRNLNRIISIEEKQKNTRTIECYASFLFMANEFEYLRVDPDERRFYLPDVGKEENKASPEVYDYLDKFLKQKEVDPQLLRDIVEYFDFNKNDNFSFSIADKSTETFWAMVKDSAFPPMRFVIETMESCIPGVEKSYAELSREWDMKKSANFQFPYFNKIKAFLLKYKPHGREIITCDDTLKSFKYLGKGEQDDQHGILRF
jgi:hypothetical protein